MKSIMFRKHQKLGALLNEYEQKIARDDVHAMQLGLLKGLSEQVENQNPDALYAFEAEPEIEAYIKNACMYYGQLRLGVGMQAGLTANHISQDIMEVLRQHPGGTKGKQGEAYSAESFKAELEAWVASMRHLNESMGKKQPKGGEAGRY